MTISGQPLAAQNRKASFDDTIREAVEAGIVLKGPEVRRRRHGPATRRACRACVTEAYGTSLIS